MSKEFNRIQVPEGHIAYTFYPGRTIPDRFSVGNEILIDKKSNCHLATS